MNQGERRKLISDWLDGRLSEAHRELLDTELKNSREAREEFLEMSSLDLSLREFSQRLANPWITASAAEDRLSNFQPDSFEKLVYIGKTKRLKSLATWGGILATCAATALALVFWTPWFASPNQIAADTGQKDGHEELSSRVCAMVTLSEETILKDGPLARSSVEPGSFMVEHGLAKLDFLSGATVFVEGPAVIQIKSAWEMSLEHGRLRANVPQVARGFIIHGPKVRVEDLGTEFAMNVAESSDECLIKVFDGEVIAHVENGPSVNILEGKQAVSSETSPLALTDQAASYLEIKKRDWIGRNDKSAKAAWAEWLTKIQMDPRLVVQMMPTQEPVDASQPSIALTGSAKNKIEPMAIGLRASPGRWSGSTGWSFKRPEDRIRFQISEELQGLTLACWIRVDALDKKYNSIFLTDGYESGEPHWQLVDDGSLMFSIIYLSPDFDGPSRRNQIFVTPKLIDKQQMGAWYHLAVTYSNKTGEVCQYCNGKLVSKEVSELFVPSRPIRIGVCEIGNWGVPLSAHEFPLRNLNGTVDDFMIFREPLPAAEIADMVRLSKPNH
jgi:ferric-dicitrate binding protein FerR (iron transport regulator)